MITFSNDYYESLIDDKVFAMLEFAERVKNDPGQFVAVMHCLSLFYYQMNSENLKRYDALKQQ